MSTSLAEHLRENTQKTEMENCIYSTFGVVCMCRVVEESGKPVKIGTDRRASACLSAFGWFWLACVCVRVCVRIVFFSLAARDSCWRWLLALVVCDARARELLMLVLYAPHMHADKTDDAVLLLFFFVFLSALCLCLCRELKVLCRCRCCCC